ncbi:MAG: ester cyclase [Chloroflexota bacterium]|nr:ester cyclase [Chloroflexota bacterium]
MDQISQPTLDPTGLAAWIRQLHTLFAPMTFSVQVAPLFQGDMIAGRWVTTGTYAGGLPGARAEPGTRVSFAGADFLRVQDGKIVEYWLSSDILDMMAQLKMLG